MKSIVIVGVGALGSHVVQFLRNVEATLRVIDFDRVEQKNVLSQFHSKASVTKSKVLGLQQTMNFLFGVKIEITPHKLVAENASTILKGDLIIDCLDNGEARRIVQNYARTTSTPCLHGALAADGGFGRVVWDENFKIDEASGTGATCEDGAHLPFIAITSAHLAYAAQEFLLSGVQRGYQVHPGGVIST